MATRRERVDLPVEGMDCQSCALHIQEAVGKLQGVENVQVLVGAERVTMIYDPDRVTTGEIQAAINEAGYTVRELDSTAPEAARRDVGQIIGWGVLGMVAVVVLVAALGERLGVFDRVLERLPWWIPALAILIGGWPVFRGVVEAALKRQVTSHTLMTAGVIAAVAIGEWTTAALIVFFMRFADWMEALTTGRSRPAIKQLTELAPPLRACCATVARPKCRWRQ